MQNVTVVSDAPNHCSASTQCFEGTLTVDLSPNTITTTYNGTKIYTPKRSSFSSIATFTAAGTYVLGIRDDNGCEDFVNYTIEEQVLANAILTKDLCAGAVNATIDITITGGGHLIPFKRYWNTNWCASCGRYRSIRYQ
jgi:hypothetical protein